MPRLARTIPWPALTALALLAALALLLYAAIPQPAAAQAVVDYDTDDDGLIDVTTIAQLQGIRFDHNGDGIIRPSARGGADLTDYNAAFPNRGTNLPEGNTSSPRMGCPGACLGYELMNNLDFDTDGDGSPDSTWTPPALGYDYEGILEGNGHTIANMNVTQTNDAGLFRRINTTGVVRNLGLIDPVVSGRFNIGALAGTSRGMIYATYATGGTSTTNGAVTTDVGGLVGENAGRIIASYARVNVSGDAGNNVCIAGGLVGSVTDGTIIASYGAGTTTCASTRNVNVYPNLAQEPSNSISVQGRFSGGLAGAIVQSGTVTDSVCDNEAAGLNATDPCISIMLHTANLITTYRRDFPKPPGSTTAEIKAPTAYTGLYANWNVDVDGDTFPDNPWRFSTADASAYPALKTPAQRTATAGQQDYDSDDDNLIDIRNIYQLNAVRHDLNGDGLPGAAADYPAYAGAFPDGDLATATPAVARMGCPQTCTGYELLDNLDFAADATAVTGTDVYPDWQPIGAADGFAAVFDGKGYTISRLTIDAAAGNSGLFDTIGGDGVIRDVGLIDASIANASSSAYVGILAADNDGGTIIASYASGGAITITGASTTAGGLLGRNAGALRAVYATASVSSGTTSSSTAGGLIGLHTGSVTASYAAGAVAGTGTGTLTGGLIGQASSTAAAATDSYCDTQTTTQTDCVGNETDSADLTVDGKTTSELQTPVGYTGIYALWNIDLDGDAFPDNPWNFGSTTTYPMLKTAMARQDAPVEDYDGNDNNLIDIRNLHQLNAIRHDLDGNGLPATTSDYAAYAGAFPGGHLNAADTSTTLMGCAATCAGYELLGNLDFAADQTAVTGTDAYPDWTPIGGADGYAATFDGNANTISRLTIVDAAGDAGLFASIAAEGVIRELGLVSASISGAGSSTGILAGVNNGEITASYAQGGTVTATGTGAAAYGGLTGRNAGNIRAAYAAAAVTAGARADTDAGGLSGVNDGGRITASYAAGAVTGTGTNIGGLIGSNTGANAAVTDSHCDTEASTQTSCIGAGATAAASSMGYTTSQLQTPTGYTGIYASWNISVDQDPLPDHPWDFGTATEYPTLNTPAERDTAKANAPRIDYDANDNNLIDVDSLQKLNAIRHDLGGNGVPDADAGYPGFLGAFPGANVSNTSTPYMGCAATCVGYELTANLDFAGSETYANWQSIGDAASPYTARFEGNHRSISNLPITGGAYAGLFGGLGNGGIIRDLAMLTPNINGETAVGAFAAVMASSSQITASYVQGGSITLTGAGNVGGIAGTLGGALRAVHASSTAITGSGGNAGGLAGSITADGSITASYAAAPVTGQTAGGLAGRTEAGATITDSYCDTTVSRAAACVGTGPVTAPGHPTSGIQSPTSYTGIYANWNIDVTGDTTADYPWYFGTSAEYPVLNNDAQRLEMRTSGDLPPPALPRAIVPEPPAPYNAAADHPEIYKNAEYEMAATCRPHEVDPETDIPQGATITFNLGSYNGPILLALSIWNGERYMAYATQGVAEPALQRQGQTATLTIETNPAQTRFRLDGSRNGLRANLLLGYADCHTP